VGSLVPVLSYQELTYFFEFCSRVYKTLTTIVDDCASFVIHMPWRRFLFMVEPSAYT
jgi:hypothetical protein